jgi:hypothetical protein
MDFVQVVTRACMTCSLIQALLQVLQSLPEGLTVAVLAAAQVDLEHQLFVLPVSLHPLAIEAVYPSIRRDHSLTLDFSSQGNRISSSIYSVLNAANTATCVLQKLHLSHIPVQNNDRLLQLVAAACKSAADVSLEFGRVVYEYGNDWRSFAHVAEALAHNSTLVSLQLTFYCDDPCDVVNLDLLLEALTGLQSLSLHFRSFSSAMSAKQPFPRVVVSMTSLTSLCLGHGFHSRNLPQILPLMTQLQALCLKSCNNLQELPALSKLEALQTLHLSSCEMLQQLPSLACLTALQTLVLCNCVKVRQLPSLATLTALQILELSRWQQILEI